MVRNETRSSNIELLRILSMILIIAAHFSYHGNFSLDSSTITFNMLWLQFLLLGARIGVNIFVLISGYFLIARRSFKTEKALKLWLQILTYSLIMFFASIGFGFSAFTRKALLHAFLPVSTSEWWFATTYFVLFLFSPFINTFLLALDKRGFKKLLILALTIWCILPSLSSVYPKLPMIAPEFSNFAWFVTLYTIGAYIRLWHNDSKHRSSYYILTALLVFLLTFLSAVIYDLLNSKQSALYYPPNALFDMNRLPVLVVSIFLFLGFKNMPIGNSRIINTVASATFGVYLLHDHEISRIFLWEKVFKNASFGNSPYLAPYSIIVILTVFAGCTLIELLRIGSLEKMYMPFVAKAEGWINKKKEALIEISILDKL